MVIRSANDNKYYCYKGTASKLGGDSAITIYGGESLHAYVGQNGAIGVLIMLKGNNIGMYPIFDSLGGGSRVGAGVSVGVTNIFI